MLLSRRGLIRPLALFAALLLADQIFQRTALLDGRLFGHWVVPYDPPIFTDWQRKGALDVARLAAGDGDLREKSLFDPELGWCPRPGLEFDLYAHDWAGCRIQLTPLGREKAPGVCRIVMVGCSFTQGAEVHGSETWSAILDERHPDLEIANLGVAGYGNDQALLRFRRDGAGLIPDEVWLGYMPAATLRITTHYAPVYQHWASVLTFKPLFLLEDERLVLVPSPARDFAEYHKLLTDQQLFVASLGRTDRWLLRSPAAFAPRGSSWTHWFATTRLFVTWRESGGRDPAPHLRSPESDVYRLTRALVLQLAREVQAQGARFRLVVLPSRPDLRAAREEANPYWAGLVEDLQGSGLECVDVTPDLLNAGLETADRFWMPQEHYSPEGNCIVAGALERACWTK
jgi:hypothetical protein